MPAAAARLTLVSGPSAMTWSGYEGLVQAQRSLRLTGISIDKVAPCKELLEAALRELAKSGAALVIAHGGQNNAAAAQVAGEFPDVRSLSLSGR